VVTKRFLVEGGSWHIAIISLLSVENWKWISTEFS